MKASNQCQKHEQNKGNNEKNATCLYLHTVLKNTKESQDKMSPNIQPSHLRGTEI